MIKGIFVFNKPTQITINKIGDLGVNTLVANYKNLTRETIKVLKDENIRVYAEVGLFAGGELWQNYPGSQPVDRKGKPIKKIQWYAGTCPNHPQLRRKRLQLIESIIENYDVDGVWLDFIRYPCHWEEVRSAKIKEYCFCSNCLQKFKKEIGGMPEGKKWIQWKCNQITNFVAETYDLTNQSGKNIKLGMFSVPWRNEDFNGAIKKVIGQDFKNLAKYIDVFSPMVYHQMCGQPTKWIHEVVSYMNKITDKPILPIIQTEDKPKKISGEEFKEEIKKAIRKPSQGTIIFFLEDLLKDKKKIEVLQAVF